MVFSCMVNSIVAYSTYSFASYICSFCVVCSGVTCWRVKVWNKKSFCGSRPKAYPFHSGLSKYGPSGRDRFRGKAATGRSANENECALIPIMARSNMKLHDEPRYIDAGPTCPSPNSPLQRTVGPYIGVNFRPSQPCPECLLLGEERTSFGTSGTSLVSHRPTLGGSISGGVLPDCGTRMLDDRSVKLMRSRQTYLLSASCN